MNSDVKEEEFIEPNIISIHIPIEEVKEKN